MTASAMVPRRGAWLAVAFAAAVGCGPRGPETFPVSGKVVPKNGDLTPFVGNMVQFQSVADPSIRAYGEVKADGSFSLSTAYAGATLPGAVAGAHKGRFPMEVGDNDGEPRQKKGLSTKYARFDKSGWEIQVPVSGEVTLPVE